jgi:hypothetical protein
MSRGD